MKTWNLLAPDWSSLDTIWRNPMPFVLWPVGNEPLLAHWMDEAVRQGVDQVEIFVLDRPPTCACGWKAELIGCARSRSRPSTRKPTLRGCLARRLPARRTPAQTRGLGPARTPAVLVRDAEKLAPAPSRRLTHHRPPSRQRRLDRAAGRCVAHGGTGPAVLIGADARVGEGCRIGPNAFIGRHAIIDEEVEVENAFVGANTYVGKFTRVSQPGVFERVAALVAGVALAPAAAWLNHGKWTEQRVTACDDDVIHLRTGQSGPLWLRRWPWLGHIATGRLRWIGALPRRQEDFARMPQGSAWRAALHGRIDGDAPRSTPTPRQLQPHRQSGARRIMKRRDILWIAGLLALGAWIGLRDLGWWSEASDTLPVLAALPLFF